MNNIHGISSKNSMIQKVLCFEFLINGTQNGIFGLRQDSQKIVNIKLIILKLLTN